jgi:hypothetical protein
VAVARELPQVGDCDFEPPGGKGAAEQALSSAERK